MSVPAETSRIKRLGERAFSVLAFLFVLSIFVAGAWTIYSRSFESIYKYGGRLALPMFVISLFFGFIAYGFIQDQRDQGWQLTPAKVIGIIGLAVIASVFAGFFYYSIGVAFKDTYNWVATLILSRDQRLAVVGLFILTVGSGLFLLRLRFRSLYGLTEVVAGVFVGTLKVSESAPSVASNPVPEISAMISTLTTDAYVAVLTAGIYLVVRGLDNMHQGIFKDPPRDLIVEKLADWLNASPAK
jgi:hypothetical protein